MPFVTGTCSNCKTRFRFSAVDVLQREEIICEFCGYTLNPEPIKNGARRAMDSVATENSSSNPIAVFQTCAYCKKQFPLNTKTLGTLQSVVCPSCLSKRGLDGKS